MKQDRIVIIVIFFIAIAISLMPRESIKAANKKPAISVTQSSKSSITISWPASKNKYYTVQMKAGNKNYKTIRRYTKGMKSYKATKLVAGQTYSFRVKSYKMSKGSKLYSSYSKVKRMTLSKSTSISYETPRTLLTEQEISTKYQDSGVMIHTYYSNGIACATGSGFVIDYKDTKYIVTAAHVIKGVYSKETGTYSAGPYIVMIIFNNGITMYCTTIYNIDFEADIAILIPDNPQDIVCNGIPLADSDAVIEGENCITITSPDGLGNIMNSVTCGKISGICEDRGIKKYSLLRRLTMDQAVVYC